MASLFLKKNFNIKKNSVDTDKLGKSINNTSLDQRDSLAVFATGPVSLLTMWTNRITMANSRKHQEFAGRVNSVNSKFELYQQLKDENG